MVPPVSYCEELQMIRFHVPSRDELWFREKMLADEETMSYNCAWGGTITFPPPRWGAWYDRWVARGRKERFYRYLLDGNSGRFVGEAAYHFDVERQIYLADVIVYAPYRRRGFGRQALLLLMNAAAENGVDVLYDDIAIDNPGIKLFLGCGFTEEYRTDEIIMLRKELICRNSLLYEE